MLSYHFIGLGDDTQQPSVLSHTLVPFRRRARYLRLVRKKSHAADYAAGGFHVSVARGLAGGCRDSSANFASGGTKATTCLSPLDRADVRALWTAAAEAYMQAVGSTDKPLEQIKQMLRVANALADRAYAAEGVEPPRDPVTGDPEPPRPRRINGVGLAIGLAGVLGMTAYAIHHGQVAYDDGVLI